MTKKNRNLVSQNNKIWLLSILGFQNALHPFSVIKLNKLVYNWPFFSLFILIDLFLKFKSSLFSLPKFSLLTVRKSSLVSSKLPPKVLPRLLQTF